MSDEKKKSDEKKNHPKTSRPVRLKLATKPLPIYKCYRVWREINNLPMPSYPIRVESSDSLLAQLEALRSYQQQLTNYGNSLETTWGLRDRHIFIDFFIHKFLPPEYSKNVNQWGWVSFS